MTAGNTFASAYGVVEHKSRLLTLADRTGRKRVVRGERADKAWDAILNAWNAYWDDGCQNFERVDQLVRATFFDAPVGEAR